MKNEMDDTISTGSGSIYMKISKQCRRAISSDFILKVMETFATRIFLIGIGVVTSVMVARILGPEGRGYYAIAVTIGAIGVQFGNLGLHGSNTYYLSRDRKILPVLLSISIFVSFVFGGLGAGLGWAVFYLWPDLAPLQGLLLILALLWIPFGLSYLLLQNLLLGLQNVRTYNKIELLSQILTVSFIALVIFFKAVTVETVFSAGLIALVISCLWVTRVLKKYINRFSKPSIVLFKNNIRYGLKVYLAAFFGFMVLRVDLLMIKYMLGAEQTGYYSIAANMADMVYMLPVVVGTILFPKLSAMHSNQEKWKFTKKVSLMIGLIIGVLTGCTLLLAEPAVRLLFGEAFLPAVPAFIWLMPGIILLSVNTIYMIYFASTGMPLIAVYSPGIASLINIILNIQMIPFLGIIGASVSSVLAYGLMLGFSLVYLVFGEKKIGE